MEIESIVPSIQKRLRNFFDKVDVEIIRKSFSTGPWGPGGGNMGGDGGYQGKQHLSCSVGGVNLPGSGNRKSVITA